MKARQKLIIFSPYFAILTLNVGLVVTNICRHGTHTRLSLRMRMRHMRVRRMWHMWHVRVMRMPTMCCIRLRM